MSVIQRPHVFMHCAINVGTKNFIFPQRFIKHTTKGVNLLSKEIEKKYIFKNMEKNQEKISEFLNTSQKKTGILQWYLEDTDNSKSRRIRLEIHKEKTAYRHVWTYCEKTGDNKINRISRELIGEYLGNKISEFKEEHVTEYFEENTYDFKEEEYLNRDEKEFTIDFSDLKNLKEKNDRISDEEHMIYEEIKEYLLDINRLNNLKKVFKIRHYITNDERVELVVDEFLNIGEYEFDIPYLMEIELKDNCKKDSFGNVCDEYLKKLKLFDFVQEAKDEKYKNKNLAKPKPSEPESSEVKSSESDSSNKSINTFEAIEFMENRLLGGITVISMQGTSINKIIANYNLYGNESNKKNLPNDYLQIEDSYTSAELDAINLLLKRGYKIKKIVYFVFPDIPEKKEEEFFYKAEGEPKIFKDLIFLVKHFFKGIVEVNKSSIYYSPHKIRMTINTFQEIWNKLEGIYLSEKGTEIIVDITSGQKYPGILAAMYCMFNDKGFFYKQQFSNITLKFPAAPVSWDYGEIDAYHSYIEHRGNDTAFDYNAYINLPQQLKDMCSFLDSDEKNIVSLLPLNKIKEKYDNARKMPFGYGEKFLEYISDENMTNFVREKIVDTWSLQWIGDQIPETVEHSQRHSKRLMEFAVNLINTIGKENFLAGVPEKLENEFFFVLAVAMNVHDLGHTNAIWKFEDGSELCLDGLPGVVRDLHNELTLQMLNERKTDFKLLEGIEKAVNDHEKILKAIELVCKYHRGYLPIDAEKKGKEKSFAKLFRLNTKPLEEIAMREYYLEKDWQDMIICASRWLRFIDGTDVQSDRTLSENYTEIRKSRTRMESEHLVKEAINCYGYFSKELGIYNKLKMVLDTLQDEEKFKEGLKNLEKAGGEIESIVYEELRRKIEEKQEIENIMVPQELRLVARIGFKIRQFVHFDKHAAVQSVAPIFLKEKALDKNKEGVLKILYKMEGNGSSAICKTIEDDVVEEFDSAGIARITTGKIKKIEIGFSTED